MPGRTYALGELGGIAYNQRAFLHFGAPFGAGLTGLGNE